MAKVSMVEREKKRQRLVAKYAEKRAKLKEIAKDEDLPVTSNARHVLDDPVEATIVRDLPKLSVGRLDVHDILVN